jgi:hypothetical protein
MRQRGCRGLCQLLACLLCTPTLGGGTGMADDVRFARGGRLRASTRTDADRVLINTPDGEIEFDHTDIRAINFEEWPERDWPARLTAVQNAPFETRCQTAQWALDHGLVTQAAALLRTLHSEMPAHEPTARLVSTLDRLDTPGEDPDLETITKSLDGQFQIARGTHVVLLHQHGAKDAQERIEHLERVFAAFYIDFSRQGMELAIPTKRLPSIWFAKRADYQAFLKLENAQAFLNTQGYYHPTRALVVTYDSRTDEPQASKRDALETQAARLREIELRIEQMPRGARLRMTRLSGGNRTCDQSQARAELAAFERDLVRQRVLLDAAWRELDLPIAAHELAHQLVAASGLAPHYHSFPIWLHEGLAMQFESLRGGRWAGLETPSSLRLAVWNSLDSAPVLAALLRDEGLEHGYRREPYAQAWAFVHFLRNCDSKTYVDLFDNLRVPQPTTVDPRRRARETILKSSDREILEWEKLWRAHLVTRKANENELDKAENSATKPTQKTEPQFRVEGEGVRRP